MKTKAASSEKQIIAIRLIEFQKDYLISHVHVGKDCKKITHIEENYCNLLASESSVTFPPS